MSMWGQYSVFNIYGLLKVCSKYCIPEWGPSVWSCSVWAVKRFSLCAVCWFWSVLLDFIQQMICIQTREVTRVCTLWFVSQILIQLTRELVQRNYNIAVIWIEDFSLRVSNWSDSKSLQLCSLICIFLQCNYMYFTHIVLGCTVTSDQFVKCFVHL